MSRKSFDRNSEVAKYKSTLKSRVDFLELQCRELELTMHLSDLEVAHRERFPEFYQQPKMLTESEPESKGRENGITEGKDSSDQKES